MRIVRIIVVTVLAVFVLSGLGIVIAKVVEHKRAEEAQRKEQQIQDEAYEDRAHPESSYELSRVQEKRLRALEENKNRTPVEDAELASLEALHQEKLKVQYKMDERASKERDRAADEAAKKKHEDYQRLRDDINKGVDDSVHGRVTPEGEAVKQAAREGMFK